MKGNLSKTSINVFVPFKHQKEDILTSKVANLKDVTKPYVEPYEINKVWSTADVTISPKTKVGSQCKKCRLQGFSSDSTYGRFD